MSMIMLIRSVRKSITLFTAVIKTVNLKRKDIGHKKVLKYSINKLNQKISQWRFIETKYTLFGISNLKIPNCSRILCISNGLFTS